MKTCKHFCRVVLTLLLMSLANYASAQAWPSKEIRLITIYAEGVWLLPGGQVVFGEAKQPRPGGKFAYHNAALVINYLADGLKRALGQPVVLQYLAGDAGIRANEAAAKAAPDGYTFLISDHSAMVLTPARSPRLSVDPIKELVPVTSLGVKPDCLIAHPGLGAKSAKDLLETGRGKETGLVFASSFSGSPQHLYALMLTRAAGITMNHVVETGLNAVLAGRADATFTSCAALARMKGSQPPLAVTGTERSPLYPDVPTLVETGYAVDVLEWSGIFAPAGTPKEIVERMAAEVNKIITAREGRELLADKVGNTLTGFITERFADIVKSEAPRWVDALRATWPQAKQPPAIKQDLQSLAAGDVFKDCDECPEMVVVPAGDFMMGSPTGERWRRDNEGPQHRVTIAGPFAAGKFSVTKAQFAAFVSETGHDAGDECFAWSGKGFQKQVGKNWRNPGYTQTDNDPVVCVSRDDAKAYAAWLARKTGKGYRLLTEAEWEYAARAGTSGQRYWDDWGASELDACRYANGADANTMRTYNLSNIFPCTDGYAATSPVGSFQPNSFGLYDMLGNASQWVQDCFNDNYKGAPANGAAWTSGSCGHGALRGGSWYFGPNAVRSSFRSGGESSYRSSDAGFRVAKTL